MENVQIFKYNENPISFLMGEQKMVNATQMAKGFGSSKRPKNFLALQSTMDFMAALSEGRNLPSSDLVIVKHGDGGGTWMHEDLAIVFAQWLSPQFYIWCNDRIKELFRFGLTATDEMLVKAATDPEFVMAMMDQLKQNRKANMELAEQNSALKAQIEENAHKVSFYDNVQEINEKTKRSRTITTSKIAKKMGMKAATLNKHLLREEIIVRTEDGYAVHPQYEDDDIAYPQLAYTPRTNEEGEREVMEEQYLVYTQAGEDLILQSLERVKPQKQPNRAKSLKQ